MVDAFILSDTQCKPLFCKKYSKLLKFYDLIANSICRLKKKKK